MKKILFICLFLIGVAGFFLPSVFVKAQEKKRPILVMDIDKAITPPIKDYFNNGLAEAKLINAQLVIVRLNTPGGLLTTTREMVADITESKIPIAMYVTPTGGQAASAGTFLMYASHITAMTTGTNIGAATPIQMNGSSTSDGKEKTGEGLSNEQSLRNKSVNDTAAFIRSLAQLNGRNAKWGEKAVRDAASLTAKEAHNKNVIDYVVKDLVGLLAAIDGKEIKLHNGEKVKLNTADSKIIEFAQDLRTKFLALITDPNIALILMNIGMLGLIVELWNPGSIIPGTIGLICLALALFAMNILPFNAGGLILLLLGIGFMVAEIFVPSFGVLGIGGVIAFIFGATILFDEEIMMGMGIDWSIILSMAAVTLGTVLLVATMAIRSHRQRIASGPETMIGAEAEILKWKGKKGTIMIEGERWKAFSKKSLSLKAGDIVYIKSIHRLRLCIAQKEGEI